MLIDTPLRHVLQAFQSPEPAPGGGAASALAGALGASLLAMVAGMSRTRDGDESRHALDAARPHLLEAADALAALVDRDTAAYRDVVAAYRLPKATEAERATRQAAIARAMRGAIEAPLDTMRACGRALDQAAIVARHGNPSARSDVAVAVGLLEAAVRGARANVDINLDTLTDPETDAAVRREADRVEAAAVEAAARARQALAGRER
ncbi:MAG TPA: cyclodeaminase/cyclohydrolase family protein [Vicinamibacterales bacterium]|nr:cyclodeaminase/cyclohydrolase family protein [Vicinamibacterales bacterium]